MGLRLLMGLFFIVISEAGFVQDNQNIFYGHSGAIQSDPVSYQSFVNYDSKFSTSDHNFVDSHKQSSKPKSTSLFKPADYADQAAYKEEVESAHRFALTNRHNNSDAAYVEAYNEALKAQRKAESAEIESTSYISHLLQYKFGLNSEQSRVTKSKDLGKGEYYLAGNHDLRQKVQYVSAPGYKFNGNGVVHR
ncbi:uncharacterized protein LOC129916527 [Episyrphus balteatus]|uniref:uncharacterized protein LOC129916527 n=1 Tax=Episyrphus balteatus TaxID=286459 RepID=UPI002486407D|nr:uncharacterized protein LOC129916527 [Episyrphus balteatus]